MYTIRHQAVVLEDFGPGMASTPITGHATQTPRLPRDHFDPHLSLAESESGVLGGHPNIEPVVVLSVQAVVTLVRPVTDSDLRSEGKGRVGTRRHRRTHAGRWP